MYIRTYSLIEKKKILASKLNSLKSKIEKANNMANFEAFQWNISSSINPFFLKCVQTRQLYLGLFNDVSFFYQTQLDKLKLVTVHMGRPRIKFAKILRFFAYTFPPNLDRYYIHMAGFIRQGHRCRLFFSSSQQTQNLWDII